MHCKLYVAHWPAAEEEVNHETQKRVKLILEMQI